MTKWDLSQECKVVKHKKISISISQCINAMERRNMIISTYAEKVFEKIQHPFMTKTPRKLEWKGTPSAL